MALATVALAAVAIVLPDWLFETNFIPHLMGHKRLLALQPSLPHATELRAAILQTGLTCAGVALASQWFARRVRSSGGC